jgi:hypothetical protein
MLEPSSQVARRLDASMACPAGRGENLRTERVVV